VTDAARHNPRVRAGIASVVLAVALTAVGVASATESTIFPGVGIGKVKLGMTQAQVERVLGKHFLVDERSANYRELGWNFGTWTVSFVGNHVVQAATTLASQKTSKGVGPGTLWRMLVRAYPHGLCTYETQPHGTASTNIAEYLVAHKGGTQTIYLVHPVMPHFGSNQPWRWLVFEVHVRVRFKPLPEFAPK